MADPTLRVRVGLDGSEASAGVAKVNEQINKIGPAAEKNIGQATKAVQSMDQAWQTAGEHAGQALERIAAAVGVAFSVDKLVEWIAKTLEASERVQNLSQMLGIGTQSLQTYGFVASITGTSLDNVATSLTRLERASVEARDGNLQSAEAFRAIGVSISDIRKLSPDQLFLKVAAGVGQLQDGADKTAIAIQLMGRGAAESIPFFNKLGTNYEELRQKAEDLGLVLDGKAQKALVDTKENTELVGAAMKGLGNQLTLALAPAIDQVAKAVVDLVSSKEMHEFMTELGKDVKQVVVIGGQLLDWYDDLGKKSKETKGIVVGDVVSWVQAVLDAFAKLDNWTQNYPLEVKMYWALAWQGAENEVRQHLRNILTSVSDTQAQMSTIFKYMGQFALSDLFAANSAASKKLAADLKDVKVDTSQWTDAIRDNNQELERTLAQNRLWASNTREAAAAMGQVAENTDEAAKKRANYNARAGEGTAKEKELNDALADARQFLDRLAGSMGGPYEKAAAQYNATIDQTAVIYQKLIDHGATLEQQTEFVSEATEAANERFREQTDATYRLDQVYNSINAKYADEIEALTQSNQEREIAIERNKLMTEADRQMLSVMGPLTEAQQKRLEQLGQLAEAHVKLRDEVQKSEEVDREWQRIVSSGFDQLASTIGDFIANGLQSWDDFGKALVDITRQFIGQIIAQLLKLTVFNGIINSMFGLSGAAALPTGVGGWLGSFLGIGGAGGDKISSGGFESIGMLANVGKFLWGAGTSTGFLNTSLSSMLLHNGTGSWAGAIGSTLGGAFGGFQLGQALGGTAGGILGAGLGGYAAFQIPYVGWALAAMSFLNSATGGKLFGTKWAPTGQSTTMFDIGAGGGYASAEYQVSKQGAFFSGTKRKDVPTPASQEAIDAIGAFYTNLDQMMKDAGQQLETTGTIVTGHYTQTLDKNGKVIVQETKILGEKYNESFEDFQARVTAESLLTLVPAAQEIAAQWKSSAQELLAGAQFLVAAQIDITKGHALVQGETLAQLTEYVQGMQENGESLVQTYTRLQVESSAMSQTLKTLGIDVGKTGEEFVTFSDQIVKAAGGLDQAAALWQAYYDAYYSDSEKQAITQKNLQQNVTDTFAAIGEDSTESMAEFRQHFEKVLPTLSAEDVVKWLQAGAALAQFNEYMGQTAKIADPAKMKAYSDFVDQFKPINQNLTEFEAALFGVAKQTQSNIDQANDLAKAAGMSGMNVEDFVNIMNAGAQAGAAALRQLVATTQQMAATLFGSSIDQLKARIAAYGNSTEAILFTLPLRQQLADMERQQAEQQKFLQATALMSNLGQISAITGQSLEELGVQMSIPLDQFAQFLHTNKEGLEKQFEQSVDLAKSSLQIADNTERTNQLLQNILDAYMGRPLTYQGESIPIGTDLAGGGPVLGTKPSRNAYRTPTVAQAGGTSVSAGSDVAGSIDANTRTLDKRLSELADQVAENAAQISRVANLVDRYGMAKPTTAKAIA